MADDSLLDRLRSIDPAAATAVSEDERRRSRALAAAAIAAEGGTQPSRLPAPSPARRRGPVLVVALGVAAAAALPLAGALTGGTEPDHAKAAAIEAIAARAADAPPFPVPTADRPYAYVRRTISGPTLVHLTSGRVARARYRQDVESWQRADGRGRLRTVRRPLTFADPRDAAASGAGRAARTIVDDAPLRAADAAAQATNGIGRPLALGAAEIAGLPDEPRALTTALTDAVARARAGAGSTAPARVGPARTVTDLAADLLSLDAVRSPVRAELVRVIGRSADVEAVPGMRDPAGRPGTGLAWRSAEGHRTVLLIDPATTRVLAQRTSIPDAAGVPSDDGSPATIDVWTTIVAAGSVAGVDQRPDR